MTPQQCTPKAIISVLRGATSEDTQAAFRVTTVFGISDTHWMLQLITLIRFTQVLYFVFSFTVDCSQNQEHFRAFFIY